MQETLDRVVQQLIRECPYAAVSTDCGVSARGIGPESLRIDIGTETFCCRLGHRPIECVEPGQLAGYVLGWIDNETFHADLHIATL